MPRLISCICLLAALSACGADGEPVTPHANVDVTLSNSGVHTGARVGARGSWWNVSVGKVF